jgi:proton-dependent oligopeptide transporter, POT family
MVKTPELEIPEFTPGPDKQSLRHPKALYVLFLTEMWERFSYYGMRAIFVLYMIKALLFDKAFASDLYGSYTGLVYLTPLLGGYLSDRYWGNRKSILVGGLMMAAGQFMLFTSGWFYDQHPIALPFFYAGLTFIIFGNGFFKPNISSMVGQLYPAGDKRMDSAFTIFYMGINLGAFIAPLVCGFIGDTGNPADFKWGFMAAGMGMVLGVVIFEVFKNKYIVTPEGLPVGAKPNKPEVMKDAKPAKPISFAQIFGWFILLGGLFSLFSYLDFGIIGSLIYSLVIVAPGLVITDASLTKDEKERIWVIFIIAFFVIFFWAAFEQAGASLTFFAEEQTDRGLFGWVVPASFFQSINPLGIIIFAPILAVIWTKLGSNNREPSSPIKQALGLFLLAIGYLVIAFGVQGVDPAIKVSMMWLVSMYFLHTIGELCLSPIGLSMVVKLSPLRFTSLLMGIWFLSTSAANKFAGLLSSLYPPTEPEMQIAQKAGIDLQSILNKTQELTPQIAAKLNELNLPAKYPEILGWQVTDLYSFFMIFAIMAGVSSIILFLLSKKLSKMSHGIIG